MITADIEVVAGEDKGQPFALTYDDTHSVVLKRGTPILHADVQKLFFYVYRNKGDAAPYMTLTDDSAAELEWTMADPSTDGKVTAHIKGADTLTRVGRNQYYELRGYMSGRYQSLARGNFHVEPTAVGRPTVV